MDALHVEDFILRDRLAASSICLIIHISLNLQLSYLIITLCHLAQLVFYSCTLFLFLGESDRCQWRQSAGGSNPSLPTGDPLRVFKCPRSSWFPSIRWRIGCRTFLRQRGSHLCWWLRQWNASTPRREKFYQPARPSPFGHCGPAASTSRQFNFLPQKVSVQRKQPQSQERGKQKEPPGALGCRSSSSSSCSRFRGQPLSLGGRKFWSGEAQHHQRLWHGLSWWQWYESVCES